MVLPLGESIEAAVLQELTVAQIEELRRTMAGLVQRTEEIFSDDRDWRSFVASQDLSGHFKSVQFPKKTTSHQIMSSLQDRLVKACRENLGS